MKKLVSIANKHISFFAFLIVLILWEGITNLKDIPKWLLPAPSQIMLEMYESRALLWHHLQGTLIETLIGFGSAILLAIFLVMMMDRLPILRRILMPFMIVSQTIPTITLAPLLMIWFGFGLMPKVVVILLVCFFPIAVNLNESLVHLDEDLLNMMVVMHATPWQIFIKLKLPSALPSFFSGLKIAATYSVMGAVIAEWVGAEKGLGIYMTRAMSSYKTTTLFAIIVLIVVLSLFLVTCIKWIEYIVLPWKNRE